MPTLCVFVIATGVVSVPDSRTHSSPVISPLPFSRWQPAKTGCAPISGWEITTVTPVRTGPCPTTNGPSPAITVVVPTDTPSISVMALSGPVGSIPTVRPRSR